MNIRPHKAFSLTELIIVLVIIALLFAAMAPIITKRHIADSGSIENIWNFVNNDTQRNAYFDPGYEGWTSSIYVGMYPTDRPEDGSISGKLVINSGDMLYDDQTYSQPQLQFRFSPTDTELSNGIDAGSLGVDGAGNINFGQIPPSTGLGQNNTVLGFSALESIHTVNNFVAVGTGVLKDATLGEGAVPYITAVGANAGYRLNMEGDGTGIYIGAGSGSGSAARNIGIGYHASYGMSSSDHGNIALGVNAGLSGSDSLRYLDNIIVNNNSATNAGMRYNTIIGYGSYRGVSAADSENDYLSYMTSIGAGACNSIGNDMGLNTCIGYGSASEPNNAPAIVEDGDNHDEHIFLGGIPRGFNGRSVMEIYTYGDSVTSANSADVVLNSNLVIRGKLYVNTPEGEVAKYKHVDTYDSGVAALNLEPYYYRCTEDDYRQMLLTYNVYVCTDLFDLTNSRAHPKTINLLLQDGAASSNVINSDERLKDNIVKNDIGLEKLLLLEPYNYTFKDDMLGSAQVGVIAQDLQKIFPTSVSKDDKGFLKIRWDEMFYAMINSVKELYQKVEEITRKIANLGKEVTVVKSQQKDIRKKLSSLDERVKKLERK